MKTPYSTNKNSQCAKHKENRIIFSNNRYARYNLILKVKINKKKKKTNT